MGLDALIVLGHAAERDVVGEQQAAPLDPQERGLLEVLEEHIGEGGA